MATKTVSKSFVVDYKAAMGEIAKLEKELAAIKNKVSIKSKAQIALQLAIMKKCRFFCGTGRKKMSKSYE